MKFTDGYWLLREGVTAAHPAEVHDVTATEGTLEIHAPSRPIRTRGDLMTGPVMTISAHAPMPDVIGVTFTHFVGERPDGLQFEVNKEEFTAHTPRPSAFRSPRSRCPPPRSAPDAPPPIAVELLMRKLGGNAVPEATLLPPRITERASTAPRALP